MADFTVEQLEQMEQSIDQERKGIKRIDKLRSIIKVINQYGKNTRMGDIDKKWALGFIEWIRHTYKGRQGKPLEQGTVVSYISQLSIAMNAAVRAEWLGENPFMEVPRKQAYRHVPHETPVPCHRGSETSHCYRMS